MSELTKLIRKTEVVEISIETAKTQAAVFVETENWTPDLPKLLVWARSAADDVQKIVTDSEKFLIKIGMVDPETGNRRFGAATESKIVDQHANALRINLEFQSVMSQIVNLNNLHPAVTCAVVTSAIDDNKQDKAAEENARLNRLQQEEAERELNNKANQIRERKLHDAMEQQQYNEKVSGVLRCAMCP